MKVPVKKTTTRLSLAISGTMLGAALGASSIVAADPHTEALEQRLQIMEEQMQIMRDELGKVREEAQMPAERVMELEEWVHQVNKIGPRPKNNMIFFRGGFARNDTDRTGDILTDANTDLSGGAGSNILGTGLTTNSFTGNQPNGDEEGWYFGAGIEHSLSEDFFGFWDSTEVLGEIMFEYKEFDQEDIRRSPLATAANDSVGAAAVGAAGPVCSGNAAANGLIGASAVTGTGAGPYGSCSNSIHVTQFTLSASPKIKFMKGSKFRPWIIPAGFAFHVISPPSDGVTYTNVGVMFGAGADYNLWNNIHVGIDARYHLTDNALDGVSIDGLTAGGYLGFGF